MEQPKFKWCRETIEQVRFKPDRDKIWDELMAHIEDQVEDMKTQGYIEEEAEARAVTAMGNPEEIGKQLNAVHKPWLGWLWRISRWLLWVSLFGMLIFTILCWGTVAEFFDGRFHWMKHETEFEERLTEMGTDRIADVDAVGELEKYTIRVEEVSWSAVSEELGTLRLWCSVEAPWYMPELSLSVLQQFCFLDEHGNRWVNHRGSGLDPGEYWIWDYFRNGWVRRSVGIGLMEVPLDTQWIDLCYDFAGRQMTIHIDLTGGEAP